MTNKQILLFYSLFAIFLSPCQNFAQSSPPPGGANFIDPTITLSEVWFHQPNESSSSGWIRLIKDPSPTNNPNTVILENGYVSGESDRTLVFTLGSNETDIPAAYISGNFGKVSAKIETSCTKNVYIRAKGKDGFDLPEKLVAPKNGILEYPPTSFVKKFDPYFVYYYDDFSLQWEYRVENSTINDYKAFETSNNYLYVTHDEPILLKSQNYVSFFDIACRFAKGKNEKNEIVNSIYAGFTKQCVHRYRPNKRCMGYWVNPIPPQNGLASGLCFTGQALVAYENATCGAWADLLIKLTKAQGIDEQQTQEVTFRENSTLTINDEIKFFNDSEIFFGKEYINVSYLVGNLSILFVKNYNFKDKLFHLLEDSQIQGIPPNNVPYLFLDNGNLLEFAELDGIKAQGNKNPLSWFTNHAITVSSSGKYYDPSYGTSIKNIANDYETDAFDGFGTVVLFKKIDEFGMWKNFTLIWYGYPNTSSHQLFKP